MKGPYTRPPPIQINQLSREQLKKSQRMYGTVIGLGICAWVCGVYGNVIWKMKQGEILDDDIDRLEKEALQLVEDGIIDLSKAKQHSTD